MTEKHKGREYREPPLNDVLGEEPEPGYSYDELFPPSVRELRWRKIKSECTKHWIGLAAIGATLFGVIIGASASLYIHFDNKAANCAKTTSSAPTQESTE